MTKYSQTYPKLTGLHNYCILKKGIERGGKVARTPRLFAVCAFAVIYLFLATCVNR